MTTHNTPDSKQEALEPCPFCPSIPSKTSGGVWWFVRHERECLIAVIAQRDQYIHPEQISAWQTRSRPLSAATGDEWLPIESAPKDGTEILLVWKWDSGIHKGETVILERWYCRTHAHLSRTKNCPNDPDCKMGWGAYAGEMTHWRHKPAVPNAAATASSSAAHRCPHFEPKGEDTSGAYNAQIIMDVENDLLSSLDRRRLAAKPTSWYALLIKQLIQRIANLRVMLSAATASSPAAASEGEQE